MRTTFLDTSFDRRARSRELSGHVFRRFLEFLNGFSQRSFALANVSGQVVDDGFVRAVLHEALFLSSENLLDLHGGCSVGFSKSRASGVQRGFALVGIVLEVLDNSLVRAVSNK